MKQNKLLFDLIIIDLFIDTEVPDNFFNTSFWDDIITSNSKNGNILFNGSLKDDNDQKLLGIMSHLDSNYYHIEKLEKVNGTNTLIIAKSIN